MQRSATGILASMEKLYDVMLVRTVVKHRDRHGESVRSGVGRKLKSVRAFNRIDRDCLVLFSNLNVYLNAYELVYVDRD